MKIYASRTNCDINILQDLEDKDFWVLCRLYNTFDDKYWNLVWVKIVSYTPYSYICNVISDHVLRSLGPQLAKNDTLITIEKQYLKIERPIQMLTTEELLNEE